MAKKTGSKKPAKKKAASKTFPLPESYTLTDLEQVKVLADPLRVRLMEAFCLERTTKQVADMMGEKSTKLYHHVEALEKVGLIHLTRTKQNRGTLEKYYQAVARSFRADASLFLGADQKAPVTNALETMLSNMLDSVSSELRELLHAGEGEERFKEEGLLTYSEVQGTDADIRKIQRRLERLMKSLTEQDPGEEELPDDLRRYRLMLAFYPLDRS